MNFDEIYVLKVLQSFGFFQKLFFQIDTQGYKFDQEGLSILGWNKIGCLVRGGRQDFYWRISFVF